MNKEDFERLKAVCEKEGFDIAPDSFYGKTYYHIEPKDIWDGVEFVEYIGHSFPTGQTIFKVLAIDNFDVINVIDGSKEGGHLQKYNCKPSTESAYIEQLKKEAFERFGEIKKGDRFKADWINEDIDDYCKTSNPNNWTYIKSSDRFFLAKNGGAPIYCEGKWATRVKERVKVEFDGGNLRFIYGKDAESKMQEKGCFKVGEFLASQLEKYLNGEIE